MTTKRGTPGKVSVMYDGYYGYQSPSYLSSLVNAPNYMRLYNEALVNDNKPTIFPDSVIANTESGVDPIKYPDTDWQDVIVSKYSPITSHSLSVSGGNNVARFAFTGNYLYQDGMIPVTWSKRLNLRANTSITLSKNFLVNLDMATIRLQRREPGRPSGSGGNRMLEDVFRVPPTILPKYPDKNGSEIYGQYVDIVNPLAYAEKGGYRQWLSDMASINIQPKWELFPGFNLKGQFSYRVNSDVVNERRDNFNFFDYYTEKLTRTWSVSRVNTPSRSSYYFLAGNADYTFTRNNHYFYAMAGYSMEQTNAEGWDVFSMVSGYAKLNYSYDDKYLLEATVRADGSSRFGPGNKFGYFPSAAVGWNVHKEAFLADSRVINNLKLRASYGLLGNENIGYYKYQTLINATTGLEEINGNANISWETVNMLDIGFDLGLFPGNRLELTFDYYNKITNDLIITPPISYVAGLAKVPVNAGKVKNNGWELAINYTEKLGKDLSLTLRPGVWYNKNEIHGTGGWPLCYRFYEQHVQLRTKSRLQHQRHLRL
ncbi:TonB-dependent receptor [Chitinophaga sedimenti]|uniref:TonB-dependent receptor domain-containing protein n=1 Tax=Chitinophaga sedimenti TaxID=2033606 RepID=UPI002003844C|nr:TonB-dependent receptor [Chitinophaga sedimenti]MCK7557415.1 TonB-dependent receptor [Chitinophaga sedimenti]